MTKTFELLKKYNKKFLFASSQMSNMSYSNYGILKLIGEKITKLNITIVVGGDGFMLQTLKKNKNSKKYFYGVNSGNYGFLMNKFS